MRKYTFILLMCIALGPAVACPGWADFVCKKVDSSKYFPKCALTGKYLPAGSKSAADCANCPKGTYDDELNNGPACKTCKAGKHSTIPARTSCIDCESGKISESGAEACTLCPTGKSVVVANANRCGDCTSRRRRGRGNVLEDTCPHAHFLHRGCCKHCPSGGYKVGETPDTSCNPCPTEGILEGQPLGEGGQCTECMPGRPSTDGHRHDYGEGLNVCTDCPLGDYEPYPKSTACKACPVGKIANEGGMATCMECGAGKFSGQVGGEELPRASGVVCLDCALGKETSQVVTTDPDGTPHTQPGCAWCKVGGHKGYLGHGVCGACPAGKFSDHSKALSPTHIADIVLGVDLCTPCPAGWANPHPGMPLCMACPAGGATPVAGSNATNCPLCPSGRFCAKKKNPIKHEYSKLEDAVDSACTYGSWFSPVLYAACYFSDDFGQEDDREEDADVTLAMQDAEFSRKVMFEYTHSVSCTECSYCGGWNQFVTDDHQTCVDCSEHFWGDDVIFYGAFSPQLCKLWAVIYITILACICFSGGLKAFMASRDSYRGDGH